MDYTLEPDKNHIFCRITNTKHDAMYNLEISFVNYTGKPGFRSSSTFWCEAYIYYGQSTKIVDVAEKALAWAQEKSPLYADLAGKDIAAVIQQELSSIQPKDLAFPDKFKGALT